MKRVPTDRSLLSVVNTVTNKVARILGKDETVRFTNIALYQGETEKKGVTTIVSGCGIRLCRFLASPRH